MPTQTTNYGLLKPLVNDATDQDLWGGELNQDMDTIDGLIKIASDWLPVSKSVNYTIQLTDRNCIILVDCSVGGANLTMTLPTAVGNSGFTVVVKKIDATAFTVTVDGNAAELVDGAANQVLTVQNEAYFFTSNNVGFDRLNYQAPTPQRVIQTVVTKSSAVSTTSAVIPFDNTKPQITEGALVLTAAITPAAIANKIQIDAIVNISPSVGNGTVAIALFQDAGTDALQVSALNVDDNGAINSLSLQWEVDVASAVATTFTVRAGTSIGGGTITINGSGGAAIFGGALNSFIRLVETTV